MLIFFGVWVLLWIGFTFIYRHVENRLREKDHMFSGYVKLPLWCQYVLIFLMYLCLPIVFVENFWMALLYIAVVLASVYNLYCSRYVKYMMHDINNIEGIVEKWRSSK